MGIDHGYVIKLIIAYTCVGVFVSTAVITILGLVRLIHIEKEHLNRLFAVLVVEVAVISVASFADFIKLDPRPVADTIQEAGATQETLVRTEQQLQQTNTVLAKIEATPTDAATPAVAGLPPRVYVHVPDAVSRADAAQTLPVLQANGALTPGIEVVGADKSPNRTEMRFFRREDAAEANKLAQAAGRSVTAKFVPGFEDKSRPRQFELWVAADPSSRGGAPAT